MALIRRLDTGDAAEATSVTSLVLGWLVAGAVAVGTLVLAADGMPVINATFLVVMGLVAASETAAVQLQAGRSALSLSLLEVFVVIAVLLLPPDSAVLCVLAGVTISHLVRRLSPEKIAFNLGQHAVATSVCAAIVMVAPAQPAISSGRLFAAMLGILAYSLINSIALAGIFARLGLASFRQQLTKRPGFLLATSIGNASVGAIAVTLWLERPSVVWIIFGPILALYLSYGSNFRIESLLSEVSTERDHLDRVVTGVQEGIVLLDDRGTIRLWNPAMTRITGLTSEQALGRPASEMLTGTDADGTTIDPVSVLADERDTAAYSVSLAHTDGTAVDTRVVHTLIDDDRGRLVGDVVMVQDLSREREAHSLKEDFVARVSHELRTPLSPLRGYAQLMLTAGDRLTDDKRREMLDTMVERVGHLERLIEDLLLVSRVASGELAASDEVTCEPTDMSEITARMSDWIARDHADRDVRVRVEEGTHIAWADPLRAGQIVTNLTKNACKYATPGTPIDVIVSSSSDQVHVAVQDHGPGIPDDKLQAIFDRFHRLEDPQRMKTTGLGLGLYIARHLAEAMGGRLDLVSERGVGSTFTLTLPAATDEQISTAEATPRSSSGARVHRRARPAGR